MAVNPSQGVPGSAVYLAGTIKRDRATQAEMAERATLIVFVGGLT